MSPPTPPEADARPHWAVMFPTYNPGPLFELALRAVLDQDPGPDRMQIAVVDDASPKVDTRALVERLAPPGRVEFHPQPRNVGLAGNWNACIEKARGRWVHILHQDDLVLPGFYDRLALADAAGPTVGAAFCQFAFLDGEGHWTSIAPLERTSPGVLDGWLERLAREVRVQCPAVVVRREVYEAVGPFRADLVFALDWEMWVRIAARYQFWYEPTVLAAYRNHPGNESARLAAKGDQLADLARAIDVVRGHLPPALRPDAGSELLGGYRYKFMQEADRQLRARDPGRALVFINEVGRHGGRGRANGWYLKRWLKAQAMRLAGRGGAGRPGEAT